MYLRLDRGYFHSGAKDGHYWWNLASDSVSFSSVYILPSSPPFLSPVLVAPYSLPTTSLPGVFLEDCVSLRVQLQLDPDLAALLVSRSTSADWLRDLPASQLWGGLYFMITRWAWGQAEEQGCSSLRPVVGCCALINCPGTPDLVSIFIWITFSAGFSSLSAYFFFFLSKNLLLHLIKIKEVALTIKCFS